MFLPGLLAQDLSKLTPEQLAAYKKYKSGNTPVTNTTPEVVTERTLSTDTEKTPVNASIEPTNAVITTK